MATVISIEFSLTLEDLECLIIILPKFTKERNGFARVDTIIIIIIYHDFLPTPRRGSHVKSGKTHTQSSRYTP